MLVYLKARNGFNALLCAKRRLHLSAASYIIKSKIENNPVPEITIDEYIWKNIEKWENKTAIICAETGRSYLYSELQAKSKSLANYLYKFSRLQQGDTVAVILPNVPEYPIVFMGAVQAGLKVTTINPLYTSDEIASQLINSEAKLVFTLTALFPKLQVAVNALKWKTKIVTLRTRQNETNPSGTIKFDELLNESHNLEFTIQRSVNDVVAIPYSSGTTGLPKGVAITHKNLVATLHHVEVSKLAFHQETLGSDQDSFPFMLPMFHMYGLHVCLLNNLRFGTKMVSIEKFTPKILGDVLIKHRPSFAYLVPPLIQIIVNNSYIKSDHIASLKNILSGAAPLRQEDMMKLTEKSKNKICLQQAYGLSETASLLTHQTSSLPGGIKLGGSGFAVCNTEIKIVPIETESKGELGAFQSGEILARGPQIMKGYYNNLTATQNTIDSEGWLHTGDVGYYDEDEHFFITDRIKDLIKVKGYQVAPAELEAVLRDHPIIADAAVIGIPSPQFGEVPKAFVVLKEVSKSATFEIEKYMAEKVSNYKQLLGGITIVNEIPKNASGKILKKVLRKL